MALSYLIDTDISILLLRGNSHLERKMRDLKRDQLAMSVISLGELLLGPHRSTEPDLARRNIRALVDMVQALALPPEAASVYAEVRSDLERRGQSIGSNDLWIAAHALVEGLTVVTNNEREFRRVRGLKVENWAK
jgi:tRNA(fMet)-specific endonuclease VapC